MAKRKRSDLDEEEEDVGEGPASPRGMPESQGQDLLEEEAEEQNAQRSTQDQVPALISEIVVASCRMQCVQECQI